MQSPPFGILGINNNNNNPHHSSNDPSKPGQGQGQRQFTPILVTNPTNRVSQHRGEAGEQENKRRKQSSTNTKKGCQPFTGDRAHSPHHPDEADKTVPIRATITDADDDVFHKSFMNSMRQDRKQWRGRGSCGSSCHKEVQGQQLILSWLLWYPPLQQSMALVSEGPPPKA